VETQVDQPPDTCEHHPEMPITSLNDDPKDVASRFASLSGDAEDVASRFAAAAARQWTTAGAGA
jgi:hypothetical protein